MNKGYSFMKWGFSTICVISLMTLFSCRTDNKDSTTTSLLEKFKKENSPLLPGNVTVSSMKLSECESGCLEPGKLMFAVLRDDTFKLKFSHWFNCIGIGEIRANLNHDTLDLKTQSKPIEMTIGSDTVMSYRMADCDCYFYFECALLGLKRKPILIRINNELIENYKGPLKETEMPLN